MLFGDELLRSKIVADDRSISTISRSRRLQAKQCLAVVSSARECTKPMQSRSHVTDDVSAAALIRQAVQLPKRRR